MPQDNYMTNEEILKSAIRKAQERGGWVFRIRYDDSSVKEFSDDALLNQCRFMISEGIHYRVIFSHNFAKAFWGDDEISVDDIAPYALQNSEGNNIWGTFIAWQYHLQQMVLSDDPIEYLKIFL